MKPNSIYRDFLLSNPDVLHETCFHEAAHFVLQIYYTEHYRNFHGIKLLLYDEHVEDTFGICETWPAAWVVNYEMSDTELHKVGTEIRSRTNHFLQIIMAGIASELLNTQGTGYVLNSHEICEYLEDYEPIKPDIQVSFETINWLMQYSDVLLPFFKDRPIDYLVDRFSESLELVRRYWNIIEFVAKRLKEVWRFKGDDLKELIDLVRTQLRCADQEYLLKNNYEQS